MVVLCGVDVAGRRGAVRREGASASPSRVKEGRQTHLGLISFADDARDESERSLNSHQRLAHVVHWRIISILFSAMDQLPLSKLLNPAGLTRYSFLYTSSYSKLNRSFSNGIKPS